MSAARQQTAQQAIAADTKTQNQLKAAQQTLATTQQSLKTATDDKKKAEATKAAADKQVAAATNAAKPKNINVVVPSTPFLLTIKPAPVTIAATPGSATVKRGAKIEFKVTIKRQNGFTGPVAVKLQLPPGVTDLTSEPLQIAADKLEGVLSITAGPNATEGQLANLVIQAQTQFNGEAAVDIPIALKVVK